MNVQGDFQVIDIWGLVRRRGKIAAMVAGLVTLFAYWVAMALPNEYESYSTVLVEPQSISPDLIQAGVRESDLTERLQLMTAQILSRPRLSRIIDQMDLYIEESDTMLREQIIDLMRSRIRVEPVLPELEMSTSRRNANTEINQFKIFFTDESSKTAMDIAQQIANDFIEQHIDERVNLSQKSLEFIEGELARLGSKIQDVDAQIATVKAANPGRLPEDVRANQERLQRLVSELASAQRSVSIARSDEAFYRSQSNAAAASVVRTNDDASPTRRIELLELGLSEYKAKGFTEKHPDVIKTKIELDAIRTRLAADQDEADDSDIPAVPTFAQQSADAEAQRAGLRVASTEEEITRLEDVVTEFELLLAETPAVAEQLDALLRESQHLSRSYQDFSNRRLEATVQAQLERRQLGEQFRVLESAFQAPEPSSPNRPLIVLLGIVFGCAFGAGIAVLLESVDSSVHSPVQLQASLSLPVLAAIPRIWLESDRAALRRSRIRGALATVGVIAFGLLGGAANYAWVNGMPSFLTSEDEVVEEGGAEAGEGAENDAPATGGGG
jgi:succinoglycan biosynthesis transport protein ExoP